jgi:type II secretion system protein L
MSLTSFIVLIGAEKWRVGCVIGEKTQLVDVDGRDAVDVRRAIEALGWRGQVVVLGVPTAWCYSASISLEGLPRLDRVAMGYRFEEELPLSAEELVCDFVMGEGAALGAGVRIDRMREAIESLEAVGVAVQCASPVAMLAAQDWAGECDGDLTVVLAAEDQHSNVVLMEQGRPTAWALCRPDDVKVQVGLMLEGRPGQREETKSLEAAAARTAHEIASGKQRAWVELRRGPLAIADPLRQQRGALNAVLAAACVVLIVGSAVMWYRGHRYEQVAKQKDRELTAEFQAQFPDWATPANVRTVLESERRKRMAQSNGDLPPEARASALDTLQAALAKTPGDLRISIDRMTFSDQTFELQGKARSMEDADALAKAARQGGLDVPPPQTRKEADGFWGFTLRGARLAPQAAAMAKD